MARQYTESNLYSMGAIDIYFPIGTLMELLCYVGLLKVAEQIKNPFGDADEDFDLNFLITRHLRVTHSRNCTFSFYQHLDSLLFS